MATKSMSKKQVDWPDASKCSVKWSDRIVKEAQDNDAFEIYVSQTITQIIDILEIQAGEDGVDCGIHKIDHHMGQNDLETVNQIYA